MGDFSRTVRLFSGPLQVSIRGEDREKEGVAGAIHQRERATDERAEAIQPTALGELNDTPTRERLEQRRTRRLSRRGRCSRGSQGRIKRSGDGGGLSCSGSGPTSQSREEDGGDPAVALVHSGVDRCDSSVAWFHGCSVALVPGIGGTLVEGYDSDSGK
jgi:hypothetical protein